ncbi:unnamed protein product [Musa acuminata subsp. burmannicoides]
MNIIVQHFVLCPLSLWCEMNILFQLHQDPVERLIDHEQHVFISAVFPRAFVFVQ